MEDILFMSEKISSQIQFKNHRTFNYTLAGRPLVVESGKLAGQANGSVLIRYGETAVLCCATASPKPREGIDFLPLSVDMRKELRGRKNPRRIPQERRASFRKSRTGRPRYRPPYSPALPKGPAQ